MGVFPHVMGSPVNIAASVQFGAAIPNDVRQVSHAEADARNEIVGEPLRRGGGDVIVPDRPGIGAEVREDKLTTFPYRPYSMTGTFRRDGSVAHEWFVTRRGQ